MNELDKLLRKYVETFHCNFPWFIERLNGQDLVGAIKTCLKEGKPDDELFFDEEDWKRINDPSVNF